jgi:hypothetical protein
MFTFRQEIGLLFAIKIDFFSDFADSFIQVNEQTHLMISRKHHDMWIDSAAFLNFPLPQLPVRIRSTRTSTGSAALPPSRSEPCTAW